jgi:hypothetical protein
MRSVYLLLPTKFETNEVKKYIENNILDKIEIPCTCLDDDFINSFKCDEFEDDVLAHLKVKIFERIDYERHCFIIIISDYKIASMLNKYDVFIHIPSKEYIDNIIFTREDYSDIINRYIDVVHPCPKFNDSAHILHYDSMKTLLKNIETCLRRFLSHEIKKLNEF